MSWKGIGMPKVGQEETGTGIWGASRPLRAKLSWKDLGTHNLARG